MSDSEHINELRKEIEVLCDNCDRPSKEEMGNIILSAMVFGFGEGLKAPSEDRPQGEWTDIYQLSIDGRMTARCKNCKEKIIFLDKTPNFCPNCGARTKGADDELSGSY